MTDDQFDKDVAEELELLRAKAYRNKVRNEAMRQLKAGTPQRVTS